MNLSDPQPKPVNNDELPVASMVMKDLEDRVTFGLIKYGELLKPFNGRDPLIDAYQEAWDLVFYLRQAIYEKYGKTAM